MTGETIHVCITSDKNTLGGAIALINSIVSNTKSRVMFHIVTDEESMDHLRYVQSSKYTKANLSFPFVCLKKKNVLFAK